MNDPSTHEAPGRRDRLTALLEEWRGSINHGLRDLRAQSADVSAVRDAEEEGSDDLARDVEVALLEVRGGMLRRLDEAIRRLDEGTYGLCAECDAPIGEVRLSALPFATLCRTCQEQEEAGAAREPWDGGALGSGEARHA
jgi:DnaK suppressor protein